MQSETSAGAMLFDEPDDGGERRWLLLLSRKGHWDFAKGHVHDGETTLAAALREVQEEAGLADDRIELIEGFHQTIRYRVNRLGRPVPKTVHYFLARARPGDVRISIEHTEAHWLPLSACLERLAFEQARQLLRLAVAHLDRTR